MSTYWKRKKWYEKYAHGKSKYQQCYKAYCRNMQKKNVMKVVFNLKEKSYKYE